MINDFSPTFDKREITIKGRNNKLAGEPVLWKLISLKVKRKSDVGARTTKVQKSSSRNFAVSVISHSSSR